MDSNAGEQCVCMCVCVWSSTRTAYCSLLLVPAVPCHQRRMLVSTVSLSLTFSLVWSTNTHAQQSRWHVPSSGSKFSLSLPCLVCVLFRHRRCRCRRRRVLYRRVKRIRVGAIQMHWQTPGRRHWHRRLRQPVCQPASQPNCLCVPQTHWHWRHWPTQPGSTGRQRERERRRRWTDRCLAYITAAISINGQNKCWIWRCVCVCVCVPLSVSVFGVGALLLCWKFCFICLAVLRPQADYHFQSAKCHLLK